MKWVGRGILENPEKVSLEVEECFSFIIHWTTTQVQPSSPRGPGIWRVKFDLLHFIDQKLPPLLPSISYNDDAEKKEKQNKSESWNEPAVCSSNLVHSKIQFWLKNLRKLHNFHLFLCRIFVYFFGRFRCSMFGFGGQT